jgi:hypothetical protein
MADTVESSTLAGDTPARRARQRSAWRLLLGHVRPYRWMILCGGFLGGLASLAEPMVASWRSTPWASIGPWPGRPRFSPE